METWPALVEVLLYIIFNNWESRSSGKGGDLIFHLSGQKNTQLVPKQQNCAFMRMSWLLGATRSVIVVEHLGVQLLLRGTSGERNLNSTRKNLSHPH